jgi:Mrp family chromosome partitioning ATPase
VIVDTPAAVFGADAAVIAAKCGAALVLARKDASKSEALRELVASLQGAPVNLAGVVFNEY